MMAFKVPEQLPPEAIARLPFRERYTTTNLKILTEHYGKKFHLEENEVFLGYGNAGNPLDGFCHLITEMNHNHPEARGFYYSGSCDDEFYIAKKDTLIALGFWVESPEQKDKNDNRFLFEKL